MKSALLWLLAIVLAVGVVWRLSRKQRVVLSGRWSPRLVHMVAVLVVGLGWDPNPAAAAPDPSPAPTTGDACAFPAAPIVARKGTRPVRPPLPSERVATLRAGTFDGGLLEAAVGRGPWITLRDGLLGGAPPRFAHGPLELAVAAYAAAPKTLTLAQAKDLLTLALDYRHPDIALSGWAFRAARDVASQADIAPADQDALVALFAEAALHAQAHTAIVESLAETGPVTFRAWMSKAAPRPDYVGIQVPADFWPIFEKKVQTAHAGPWDDLALDVEVVSGASTARLRAYGGTFPLVDGAPLQLTRLDLIQAGKDDLVLRQATLGLITVPAGKMLTAMNAREFLRPEARLVIGSLVARAMTCDRAAMATLQSILPAAQQAVRDALAPSREPTTKDTPTKEAPGAPGLRLLMTLFDE